MVVAYRDWTNALSVSNLVVDKTRSLVEVSAFEFPSVLLALLVG